MAAYRQNNDLQSLPIIANGIRWQLGNSCQIAINCDWQSGAIEGNQRQSKAIKGNRWQSKAIEGNLAILNIFFANILFSSWIVYPVERLGL
jgi:hypothetical protein